MLGWSPAVFWSVTLTELSMAFDAVADMHGPGNAPSRDELAELLERFG